MNQLDLKKAFSAAGRAGAATTRRAFISRLIGAPLALAAGAQAWPRQQPPITSPNAPYSRAFDFASLKSWITSNEEFFVRSHFGVPKIDPRLALKVTGGLGGERAFTMDDLLRLPQVEQVATLECAGNLVGWGGVSNARWRGVRLGALLEATGVSPRAAEVILVGADGGAEREAGGIIIDAYARAITLQKALDPATIIAFEMNREALPPSHGGPLRAVVPGWYGMDSVKWLKQIIVAHEPFRGFYQTNRYYEARRVGESVERRSLNPMRVKSQFARPIKGELVPLAPVALTGAAWTGEAEIEHVELSFDRGASWQRARLGADRAPFAWRLWAYDWTPPAPGAYEIMVRARDTASRTQPLERDSSIITPYANNWVDRRSVVVGVRDIK